MARFYKLKEAIANFLFKDVLYVNRKAALSSSHEANSYKNFHKKPNEGINFYYKLYTHRLLENLEELLSMKVTDPSQLFNPLFESAGDLTQVSV